MTDQGTSRALSRGIPVSNPSHTDFRKAHHHKSTLTKTIGISDLDVHGGK